MAMIYYTEPDPMSIQSISSDVRGCVCAIGRNLEPLVLETSAQKVYCKTKKFPSFFWKLCTTRLRWPVLISWSLIETEIEFLGHFFPQEIAWFFVVPRGCVIFCPERLCDFFCPERLHDLFFCPEKLRAFFVVSFFTTVSKFFSYYRHCNL